MRRWVRRVWCAFLGHPGALLLEYRNGDGELRCARCGAWYYYENEVRDGE